MSMMFGAAKIAAVACLALGLTACRGGEKKVPTSRVVYTTLDDCADAAKLSFEKCNDAIERALSAHEKSTTKHKRQQACEDVEGPDRCERAADGSYRARPAAYLFTISSTVTAIPLYRGLKGASVFRAQDGSTYTPESTANIEFSAAAAKRVVDFAATGKNRRS